MWGVITATMMKEFVLDLSEPDVNGDYFDADVLPQIVEELIGKPLLFDFQQDKIIGHVISAEVIQNSKISIACDVPDDLELDAKKASISFLTKEKEETPKGINHKEFKIIQVSAVEDDFFDTK